MIPLTTTHITEDQKLSDIILANPRIMLLLEHFNLFVPIQEKTIRMICSENNLNANMFLTFANLYSGASSTSVEGFSFKETEVILTFLKNSHLYYTHEMYPLIHGIIKQMNEVNKHKEMFLVEKFFNEYFHEVKEHLNYEDTTAFPYMKNLYDHILKKKPLQKSTTYSIKEYKEHHDDIEEKLNDLKNLLIKYLPVENDQKLRRNLIFHLSELEFDLNIHARIEDMILIPLVEEMERLNSNPR